jgi:hypothetical protein
MVPFLPLTSPKRKKKCRNSSLKLLASKSGNLFTHVSSLSLLIGGRATLFCLSLALLPCYKYHPLLILRDLSELIISSLTATFTAFPEGLIPLV